MEIPLIDQIRVVPEIAVRLYCGAEVVAVGDAVRVTYEGRSIDVPPVVHRKAQQVARMLAIRPRMLRLIQDVLDIRHDAEDCFLKLLFNRESIPTVLFVPAGTTASGYYRAMFPADLANEGGRIVSHWTSSVDLSKVLRYEVLWIQLITGKVLHEIARLAKEQGVKIVYDVDDRLDAIPDENQAKVVYGTPEKQAEIQAMFELADLVTVSTEPLARHVAAHGARAVKVLPNQLPANVAPRRQTPDPKLTRILWAGSPTHKRDLAIVAPALKEVLERGSGSVRFTLFGERIPEVLADCRAWIDLREPVDFEEYHDALAAVGADFGIAPLEANTFNESKSAIKALEYASAGYPMLLSPVGEYPAVVEAGLPAELVADGGWATALDRMLFRSRDERDAMGKAATDWVVRNRCIGSTHADQWADVVCDLTKDSKRTAPEGVTA
jgi:glycosyltransferase involved in cell wall biosynthesis